jgi:carboxylesterase
MVQNAHLDPAPFFLSGGRTGVLLIHGYTGAPPEMRWVGDYLYQRGMTVAAPRLPGHGTTPDDMNRRRWREWTAHVEEALDTLQARCRPVFVAGLSMGSLLALHLAIQRPALPGIVLYSPAVWVSNRLLTLAPFVKHLKKMRPKSGKSDLFAPEAQALVWGYDVDPIAAASELLGLMRTVRRRLSDVTCPALILYSTCDRTIHAESAQRTFARLGSRDKQIIALDASGHCITVDGERERVAAHTYEFICAHGG